MNEETKLPVEVARDVEKESTPLEIIQEIEKILNQLKAPERAKQIREQLPYIVPLRDVLRYVVKKHQYLDDKLDRIADQLLTSPRDERAKEDKIHTNEQRIRLLQEYQRKAQALAEQAHDPQLIEQVSTAFAEAIEDVHKFTKIVSLLQSTRTMVSDALIAFDPSQLEEGQDHTAIFAELQKLLLQLGKHYSEANGVTVSTGT